MNTKQTAENNVLTKLITNTIQLPVSTIAKLSNKNYLHNRAEASALEMKQPSDINKAKALNKQFTNFTYNTEKINRLINHKIKDLPTDEILL